MASLPSRPFNCERPLWKPLERVIRLANLPLQVCDEFMWMCEQPEGEHQYKHRDTRRYLFLNVCQTQQEVWQAVEALPFVRGKAATS